MVYDCFSFFNELDILEIRLNTLNEVVDKFVLVEATRTHSGLPKPLYFEENKQRFAPFLDKIIHVVVDDEPRIPAEATNNEKAWAMENYQRNAILKGLSEAQLDDTIIIADLDEIPSPDAILQCKGIQDIVHFFLRNYYFFVNYRNITDPTWDGGPQALPFKLLKNGNTPSANALKMQPSPYVNKGFTPTMVRYLKPVHIIKNAGWHFSYCGGYKAIQKKLKSFAHTEFNNKTYTSISTIKRHVERGEDIHGRGQRFVAEPIDSTFPRHLVKNLSKSKYALLIYPLPKYYRLRMFPVRIKVCAKRILLSAARRALPSSVKNTLYKLFYH